MHGMFCQLIELPRSSLRGSFGLLAKLFTHGQLALAAIIMIRICILPLYILRYGAVLHNQIYKQAKASLAELAATGGKGFVNGLPRSRLRVPVVDVFHRL